MQAVKGKKGLTVFVMDDNQHKMPTLTDGLYQSDPWYDGLYEIRGRIRGKTAWKARKDTNRFDQIINTAFAIKSEHSTFVQVSDVISYVYRRHYELMREDEAYEGEQTLYAEWVEKLEAARVRLGNAQIPALTTLMALGWTYIPPAACMEHREGNSNVVIKSQLIEVLKAKRFDYRGKTYPLSANSIDQILRDLTAPSMGMGLLKANEAIYNQLTLGITVTEFINGKKHSPTIKIIDWDYPDNNSYTFTEEFEVLNTAGTNTRRPDIVCFVNGLPLVVIEAKRAASGNPNKSMIAEGISQSIRNQRQDEIPQLFAYSQLLMSINGSEGRYGTTKTSGKFWANWQEEEISEAEFARLKNLELTADQKSELLYARPKFISDFCNKLWAEKQAVTDQDRLLISLLSKDRLLEFIRYFILFDRKNGKIAARYQQVFGIKNLIAQITQKNPDGSRMGGVIWHTTGSGKSFTMVFLCKAMLIHPDLAQCRIIAVTERLDLEKQLAKTFLSGGAFGAAKFGRKDISSKYKASTGKDLAHRISKGNERIIFSIINKFGTAAKLPECHNPSADIIVLVDEGHRSQGGENHSRR